MIKPRLLLLQLMTICWLTGWSVNGAVTLTQSGNACTIRNDFVSVYISKNGEITSLLKYTNNDRDYNHSVQLIDGTGAKGYFSFTAGGSNQNYSISEFYVKQNTDDVVEVQYVTNYKNGIRWVIEYIVTRDVSGVYNYAQLESKAGSGALNEARMGLRVSPTLFNYAYVNEHTQGTLPTPAEMTVGGEGGCTKVTDATYKLADGTIYTKYNFAAFQKDDAVHGLMGNNIGVWTIAPSVEWLNGGPMRQDLTVHATETTPIMLRHFHGNHFGGASALFTGNKKLYGPHLIYVNQSSKASVDEAHAEMVADAKTQAVVEQNVWPNYSWLRDTEVKKRGTVTGQITMSSEDADYFKTTKLQVVLAQPGSKPMLQGTDYQFWAETDADGNFIINNVRGGSYSLYAYALNGSATGYYVQDDVTVTNGNTTALGTMAWVPDANRYDEVLWQIGQSDHLADGFNMSGSIRQYGRTNSIPADLTFTIGESDEATDWYYAQAHNGTWTIKYNLTELPTYPLRLTIASAGAANAKLTVRSNETTSSNGVGVFRPVHDGSVSRCATLAGRDSVVIFDIPVSKLKVGENSLNLSVWGLSTDELGNDLGGLMYDMIKLERKNSTIQVISEETAMGFNGETVDNPTGLTAITNFNNTGFYLRGSNDYKIPLRVPGKDTRQFTFSDGTVYASQNFVTLQGQSKNDYSSLPAANGGVSEASRLNIGFQTTVPGTVYVAFQSQSNPAEGSALHLALNGNVVESASLQTAAAKTARLDVLEYTADEAGTFFIDSYKSASNVFYVRFVPTEEPAAALGTSSHWNFRQYATNEYLLQGNGAGAVLDYSGLYLHVNNSHTVQAKTSTLPEAQQIAGVTYKSGVTPSIYFNGGAGTVAKNVPASSERHNVDALGLDVTTAGTWHLLVQTPAARDFTFHFGDATTVQSVTEAKVAILDYHVTGEGTLMLTPSGSFYLVAAAFVPDEEAAMTRHVDLSSAGYATFSAAQNYSIPEGLKAYVVSNVTSTEVTMTSVTMIPACTGVVLKGEEGSYILISTNETEEIGTNYLLANLANYALEATTGSYYNYTLAAGPTFKKSSGNGVLTAGKAFLRTTVLPESVANGMSLNFDEGDVTKIENLTTAFSPSEGVVYDLQGRRVAQLAKGLYIINGKKVVIR